MVSKTLCEARQYEEVYEKQIAQEERPEFHLSPRVGWMNDPNGFSYYNGKYHLFYQYHPYSPFWGPMHWGHAVSDDLICWEYLPAALAPDQEYDKEGCFSGSAVELPDGKQLLIYTGVSRVVNDDGTVLEKQQQCIAVGDGINYKKYEGNPVIDYNDIPEGCSISDFRDPKIWKNEDGTFSCAAVNLAANKSGQILLFTSENGFDWTFKSVLLENQNKLGIMWECPDVLKLDGKDVILISPMEMLPEGLEYHNGHGTVAFIGNMDQENGTFQYEKHQAVDYGIDFYAMQTVKTPDGRTVMIGWMQNWVSGSLHSSERKWFGQMSLPREISIKNGRLIQKPISELEKFRSEEVTYRDIVFSDLIKLEKIQGRKIDLEIEIMPEDETNVYHKFTLCFAQDEKYYTAVSFRPHESVLKIDRKFSGLRCATIHQRRCKVLSKNGRIKLRLILDQFSAEVFVNDGEQVMTVTMYTDQTAKDISFLADGIVRMNVVKYDLVK